MISSINRYMCGSYIVAVAMAVGLSDGAWAQAGSGPMPDLILPAPDAPAMWSTQGVDYLAVLHVGQDGYDASKSIEKGRSGTVPAQRMSNGVRIYSDSANVNGVLVDGKGSSYLLEKAVVELRGAGRNDFAGIGAGVLSRAGTLVVRDSKIVTYGNLSSATTSTNGGRLYVFDSELVTHGGALPKDYKPMLGAGMMTPPPGLGLSGTARASLTLDNSESYFFRSKIVADAWGALSTDGANGYVYVEANDSDIRVLGNGYGTYADYGAHVVLNRSRLDSGNYAAIVAGAGRLDLNEVTSNAGGNVLMVHSVMRPENEVSIATLTGGTYVSAKTAILVRSANADITLDSAKISSAVGVLYQATINPDFFATKVTDTVPGTRLRLTDMQVAGDILNDDYQRATKVQLTRSTVRGAMKDIELDLQAGSQWIATRDSVIVVSDGSSTAGIDALAGVTVKASSRMGKLIPGRHMLKSGGTLEVQ